jgi:hypothetical protein
MSSELPAILRDPSLPATPAGLQAECQKLRAVLVDASETRLLTVARAPEVVGRLWDAMRMMGGVVPEQPDLPACTEMEAFVDVISENAKRADLQRAVDTAFAWCETRVRQAAPPAPAGVDPESVAIACLFQHADWSLPQIAAYVGVSRQTLYNWPKFREAAAAAGKLQSRDAQRGSPPPGHKTADGRVEAYEDPNENA